MKNVKHCIAVILLLCLFLSACTQTPPATTNPPQQAKEKTAIQSALDFYIECCELRKTDFKKGFLDNSHYERQTHYELALANPALLVSYDILRIEQLSEDLWIVEAFYIEDKSKLGYYDVNYLAKFDGIWKFMPSIEEIPEHLKEGVEFEEYNRESPGIL